MNILDILINVEYEILVIKNFTIYELRISEKYMTFRFMKYILKPDSSMLCTATEYCYLFT